MPDTEPTATATPAPGAPEDSAAEQMLAEAVATQPDPWADPESARREIEKVRREAATWRTKYREAEPLAQRARELEESQKSELQRAQEQLAAAQKEAEAARTEALRLKVATAKGIPAALIGRLQGSTEEELAADADALLSAFPQPQANGSPHTPVEALRPGTMPSPPEPTIGDQIAAAEKAGDWATARQLKSVQLMRLHEQNV